MTKFFNLIFLKGLKYMTISRRGRLSKWDKIQKTIKNANPKTIQEVYTILEQFRLTSAEDREIAGMWQAEQNILKTHQKGVYAQEVTA